VLNDNRGASAAKLHGGEWSAARINGDEQEWAAKLDGAEWVAMLKGNEWAARLKGPEGTVGGDLNGMEWAG
jgi:hypothetical protein